MALPRELISDAVLRRKVEFVIRMADGLAPVNVATATPPPASAPLPLNVLLVIAESPAPTWLSMLMAPPIALAALSLNVLLVALIEPRTRIAPPPAKPPGAAVEKLLLKTLSVTVSFAKTLIAPPDHAAMLLLNSQELMFSVLPVNESAPPSLTLLNPLLTVSPEMLNDSTTPANVKMR